MTDATDEEDFGLGDRPWPSLLSAISGVKAAPVFLVSATSVLWLNGPVRLTPWYFLGLAAIAIAIESLARLLARPRGRLTQNYRLDSVIKAASQDIGVPTPTIIVRRSGTRGVYLRGWTDRPAIVVTEATFAAWRKWLKKSGADQSPEDRQSAVLCLAQLSHELAHLKHGDLSNYFRLRALSLTSVLVIASLAVLTPLRHGFSSGLIRGQLLAGLMFIVLFSSMRDYLRSREYAADAGAAAHGLGRATLDAMPQGDVSPAGRMFGTHPSVRHRRKALQDPSLLVSQVSFAFFALGLALPVSGRFLSIWLSGLLNQQLAHHVALALCSLIGGVIVGRFVLLYALFHGGETGEIGGTATALAKHLRSLGWGVLLAYLILVPEYGWKPLAIYALMIAVGSRVVGYLSLGISVAFVLLGRYFGRWYLAAIFAIGPTLFIMAALEGYLLSVYLMLQTSPYGP